MVLSHIEAGSKGHDLRMFKCSRCEHAHVVSVDTDPMKSGAMKWVASGLKPPK
jgi:hypothetical protein